MGQKGTAPQHSNNDRPLKRERVQAALLLQISEKPIKAKADSSLD
jgi:hypothetical protein